IVYCNNVTRAGCQRDVKLSGMTEQHKLLLERIHYEKVVLYSQSEEMVGDPQKSWTQNRPGDCRDYVDVCADVRSLRGRARNPRRIQSGWKGLLRSVSWKRHLGLVWRSTQRCARCLVGETQS